MTSGRIWRTLAAVALAVCWLTAWTGVAAAADPVPPGPPFPDRAEDTSAFDPSGALRADTVTYIEQILDMIALTDGPDIVVYVQAPGGSPVTAARAQADAAALADQWGIGQGDGEGLVVLVDLEDDRESSQVAMFPSRGFARAYLNQADLDEIRDEEMVPILASGDLDSALLVGLAHITHGVLGPPPGVTGPDPGPGTPAGASNGEPGSDAPPAGPPFPDPEVDRAVYDFAGIFSPEAIADAEATIDGIEARTGAEVVVYTQPTGEYGIETSETEARARALIDQWGIGRAGFDDGMVVFFDLDPSNEHGQVQLYAAPGFEAAYLTNSERQAIFDDDMLPYLRVGDFDGALRVAMERIDAAATPEHAASLQNARQLNAVLGLVGAPVVFFGLAGWSFVSWRRYGKDPVYLDDPSVLMPAPPPDLTAATGAMVMDGETSRRALTTAMLDLASRGLISFREDRGLLGMGHKVGIDILPPAGDPAEEARRQRNARRPIGPAERLALSRLQVLGRSGTAGFIDSDDLPKFGEDVADFDRALEAHAVNGGWYAEAPSKVANRWSGRGVLAIVGGIVALFVGFTVPISGLTLIGVAAIVGGVIVLVFAQAMPAVTHSGSMIRAMLAAYRRTLKKTMAMSRSMQQVVDEAGLDWLETPDQAVVWGTALGLQSEIEDVLQRSLKDVKQDAPGASNAWFPAWYTTSSGQSFMSSAASGSGGSLFSGSAIPDLGGMMSALGTIGNSPPSSSSSSGGGGFSGGSSGGGGGGAGGGF